ARFYQQIHAAAPVVVGSTLPHTTQGWQQLLHRYPLRRFVAQRRDGTRLGISTGGVSDDVWATARRHYDEDQLAALVSLIALINTFNRINVITRQRAGNDDLVAMHERENPAAQPN